MRRLIAALWCATLLAGCATLPVPQSSDDSAALRARVAAQKWTKTPAEPFRGKQDDVFFLDANIGWYVNGTGKLFSTRDGGASWKLLWEKPGTFFRTVAFVDEKHGYVGNVGTDYFPDVKDETPLYETRDGGLTWAATKLPEFVKGLCAIDIARVQYINHGVSAQRTMIHAGGRVGGPPGLVRSLDAGATWKYIDLSKMIGPILDVKFFNENVGFVMAGTIATTAEDRHAVILKTINGGATWKEVYRSARPNEITWKGAFPTDKIGYVTIQSYDDNKANTQRYVAKTTDGGDTWREIPLVADHAVREFGVAFVTPEIGWVGAIDGAYQTVDGGANWAKITADDIGRGINKFRVLRTPTGFVAYSVGTHVAKFEVK
jgi:photosystem II stability/assembly factor-like uncharacterized protein